MLLKDQSRQIALKARLAVGLHQHSVTGCISCFCPFFKEPASHRTEPFAFIAGHGLKQYLGPQFPTTDTDPVCRTVTLTVNCMRICADLPAGKVPDERHVKQSIVPGGYARFDKWEAFDKGNHWRVCYRTKNWANSTPNNGQARTFTFQVPYQASGSKR